MKNLGDRSLLIGVVLVGFVIAALTWLVGVSPKLSAAATAQQAAMDQRNQNDILQVTLAERERDAVLVPTYKKELYEIRDVLPPNEDIPGVRGIINRIVSDAGLVVDNDSFTTPVPVPGGISLAAPMEEVGLTSPIEGMTFTTLYATDFSFEILGPWDAVDKVLLELEASDHRYLDITSCDISLEQSDTSQPGQVRASIGGTFFTLDYGVPNITVRPVERPWPGSESGIEPPVTPRNPFLPIGS